MPTRAEIYGYSRKREADLEKLSQYVLAGLDRIRYDDHGTISLDYKRPFGNSDVASDILDIIGADKDGDDGEDPCWSSGQRDYALTLFDSVVPYIHKKYLHDETVADWYSWKGWEHIKN